MKRLEKKLLRALKQIQKECSAYYEKGADQNEIVQNIWRTANFAVINAEKK